MSVCMYVSSNECKCNNFLPLTHSSVSSSVSFSMYVCILARFLFNRNVSFSVIHTNVSCTYVCPYDCEAQFLIDSRVSFYFIASSVRKTDVL